MLITCVDTALHTVVVEGLVPLVKLLHELMQAGWKLSQAFCGIEKVFRLEDYDRLTDQVQMK